MVDSHLNGKCVARLKRTTKYVVENQLPFETMKLLINSDCLLSMKEIYSDIIKNLCSERFFLNHPQFHNFSANLCNFELTTHSSKTILL